MKRHCLFSLTLFLCSFAAFPQAIVTLGDPYAVIDADGKFYFAHHGEILTVKTFKNEAFLQKMDAQTLKFLTVKHYKDFPEGYLLKMITKIKSRYFMFYSLSSEMVGTGFYNKSNDWYNADGVVLIRFGANGGKSEKKTFEIPLTSMNQYASTGSRRENTKKDSDSKADVEYMRFQEAFISRDGAIVLVGEQQFISGSANTTRYNYHDFWVTRQPPT